MADDYFYDTYAIPKPDNYEELKAQMEEVISAHTCAYNQITAKLDQVSVIQAERKA